MGCYSKKVFVCPFFKQDARLSVYCEGGKVNFPDRRAAVTFQDRYCASYSWEMCSLAKALVEHYEIAEMAHKQRIMQERK